MASRVEKSETHAERSVLISQPEPNDARETAELSQEKANFPSPICMSSRSSSNSRESSTGRDSPFGSEDAHVNLPGKRLFYSNCSIEGLRIENEFAFYQS